MKYIYLVVIVAALAAIGATTYVRGTPGRDQAVLPESEVTPTSSTAAVPTGISVPAAAPAVTEAESELSLLGLSQREFNGRDLTLYRVLADNEAYTRHYVTYKSGDLTISGIMNVPKGAGPFPVLILNHGFIDPAVYTNGRGLRREQDYLARHGYAVLHPDYRNHAESTDDPESDVNLRLGYVEDVINAVVAVKAANLPTIDANRVGMLGHSMGGGVTFNTLVAKPDLVQAAVLFAPVSADMRDNFEKWLSRRPEVAQKIIARFGAPDDSSLFWRGVSAINFFDRVQAPVLIHHGTADDSVPQEWSQQAADALKQESKDVTLHIYSGEPHEFAAAWPIVMQRTVEFFDEHLK